jgi:hypothetical protein
VRSKSAQRKTAELPSKKLLNKLQNSYLTSKYNLIFEGQKLIGACQPH